MNRQIALLTITLLSLSCLCAQEYASFLIPDSLKENANAVVRNHAISINISSPQLMVVHVKKAVTVFNEDGKSEAYFDAGYDNYQQITGISITGYDKLGMQVKKVKQKDIKDMKYYTGNFIDDVRLKKYHAQMSDYPYTIEYEYTTTYNGFVGIPGWYPYHYDNVGVEKSSYKITYPKNYSFHTEQINFNDTAVISETSSKITKRWELRNLPPKYYEPFSPVSAYYAPQLKLTPIHFYYDGYPGDLSDWDNFGLWEKNLIDKSNTVPEELKHKLDELTEGLTTDIEKVKVLYDFLQNNTRYISIQLGIGGWKPIDVTEVYEKGYGDCKALSNYMVSMLNYVGVNAYNVVIRNSNRIIPIQKQYPTFNFNHMIACVPNAKDTLWLECTSQKIPFGYIGSGNSDKDVMLVTEEGGKLVKSPTNDASKNKLFYNACCTLNTNGDIRISSNKLFTNNAIENKFSQIYTAKKDQQIQLYKTIRIQNATIDSFHYNFNDEQYELTETVHLHAGKYASQAGSYLFLPITPDPEKFNYLMKPNGERLTPIETTQAYHNIDTIVTRLPEGYACKSENFDTTLQTPFGDYHAHFYNKGDELYFIRDLIKWHKIHPPEMVNDFISFYETIEAIETRQLVIYKPN